MDIQLSLISFYLYFKSSNNVFSSTFSYLSLLFPWWLIQLHHGFSGCLVESQVCICGLNLFFPYFHVQSRCQLVWPNLTLCASNLSRLQMCFEEEDHILCIFIFSNEIIMQDFSFHAPISLQSITLALHPGLSWVPHTWDAHSHTHPIYSSPLHLILSIVHLK